MQNNKDYTHGLGCINPGCQVAVVTRFCMVGAQYLWTLGMELASCHFSDTQNFEMAPRFIGHVCSPHHGYLCPVELKDKL